ncbi:iron-sulfur cluster assembly accessory protein [Buchnera aphidicola (Muscaphis stroyani)]|uniref:Iron-sulfur cluster assembly accessory protein n=1 Tax=Buchnera aphidicola (Muscaphis stroyani) TaxID=1241869 RepID=A0A4D6Y456_9GAMM|nr:iron-sulfur cluster assembly accessory protein [Buchnera aphidicola]QCI24222.1 iron-sulfur cluster assembly accessory protein [Buchnera aphidicola (Muscaphis stroyani)]
MKEKKINSNYKKNDKSYNIKITESAIKQITFLTNLSDDKKSIRLSIKKSGCAGFKYTMTLAKKKHEKEIVITYKNISIYVNAQEANFLNGIEIDFINSNINKIFKFYNKKLNHFCGCGESFSLNENDFNHS